MTTVEEDVEAHGGSGDRQQADRPEETRKMARATSAPVPVIDSAATGETGAGSATSGVTSAGAAKGAKAGKTINRNLGGPWGASFLGLEPNRTDGKHVHGLSWPRKHTTAGVHPYDEIEWELRT